MATSRREPLAYWPTGADRNARGGGGQPASGQGQDDAKARAQRLITAVQEALCAQAWLLDSDGNRLLLLVLP